MKRTPRGIVMQASMTHHAVRIADHGSVHDLPFAAKYRRLYLKCMHAQLMDRCFRIVIPATIAVLLVLFVINMVTQGSTVVGGLRSATHPQAL